MVQDPSQFDVLVMPNLYGDILRFMGRLQTLQARTWRIPQPSCSVP
ncbi:IDH3A isoform 21 [Pongo abelii]|nr:IDH3A isoform 21 [Pongo abelii]